VVEVPPGPHYVRQAIEQRHALDMASSPGESSHELLQVYKLGIDVCGISKLSVGQWKGYDVFIFVRDRQVEDPHGVRGYNN
jgi:hypothetical protein